MTRLIEKGDPTADGRALRRCLGQFATGVTVMTAAHDDVRVGMSVNSFSALSLDPPLVLWSIRKESASLECFRRAGHFAVNVLEVGQVEVANAFASPKEDKFAGMACTVAACGAPLLEGRIAEFECALDQVLEGGDHLIMIGRVLRFARHEGQPLLFTQGRYAVTAEHPSTPVMPSPTSPAAGYPADVETGSLLRLLHYASNLMSAAFSEYREHAGLSVAELRILGWLLPQARHLEQLRDLAYLGRRDADDTVAGMLARGDLLRHAGGCLELTVSGRDKANAISAQAGLFELELVKGIPPRDLAVMRQVVSRLAQRLVELRTDALATPSANA